MLDIFLTALALLLVIEGVLPFAVPRMYREMMQRLATREDRNIRIMGFLSLLAGTIIMILVHSGLID